MRKQDINHTVANLASRRYWYQHIEIDGTATPVFNKEMAETIYYNSSF